MPKVLNFEIVGAKELINKLNKMGEKSDIQKMSEEAVTEAAQIMNDRMVALAPEASRFYPDVPEGFLKRNINFVVDWIGQRAVAAIGPNPHINYPPRKSRKYTKTGRLRKRVLKSGKYSRGPWAPLVGAWLEFGTSKMAAHPFMRPAFSLMWRKSLDAMGLRVKAFIDEFTK